jgi:hypothetical protein
MSDDDGDDIDHTSSAYNMMMQKQTSRLQKNLQYNYIQYEKNEIFMKTFPYEENVVSILSKIIITRHIVS